MLYEPPYGPGELTAPPLGGQAFLDLLAAEKKREHPGVPPFYEELCSGNLSETDLQLWVKDMYSYWEYALRYSTGAIFVKTNDEPTRSHILRKLIDIEGKDVVNDLTGWTTPSYEELWLRFGEGLGLARQDVVEWKPFTRTYFAQTALCTLSRWWEWSWLDGIASFYAGDLYNQEYLSQAHQVLRRSYNVPDESLEFFRVYLDDVLSHIQWEQETLAYWCCTRERQLTATKSFRYRLDVETQLLSRLHTAVTTDRLPLQVP